MADPLSAIQFHAPLPIAGRITSGLADPRPYGVHEGIDIAAPAGTEIYAIAPGRVSYVGYMEGGYGYHVRIDHGNGIESLYAHMREAPAVVKDTWVEAGTVLGRVGSTGYSTGNHLHLSVFVNGVAQDVERLLNRVNQGVAGVRARLDSNVPCSEHLGNLIDWAECMGLDASDPTTNTKYEDALILAGRLPDSSAGSLDLDSLIDLSPIKDAIENAVLDVLTFPLRLWANAIDIADPPLTDGKAAWRWANDTQNIAMFATSIAVTLLAMFILLIAVWSFVAPGAIKVARVVSKPELAIAEAAE